jgi:hypothetical protein
MQRVPRRERITCGPIRIKYEVQNFQKHASEKASYKKLQSIKEGKTMILFFISNNYKLNL